MAAVLPTATGASAAAAAAEDAGVLSETPDCDDSDSDDVSDAPRNHDEKKPKKKAPRFTINIAEKAECVDLFVALDLATMNGRRHNYRWGQFVTR